MTEVDIKEPIILMNVGRTYKEGMAEDKVFDIVSHSWKVGGAKKDKAKYVLAEYKGKVVGVFTIFFWNKDENEPSRTMFTGVIAPPEIKARYMGISVQHYRKKGQRTAFMYLNCES